MLTTALVQGPISLATYALVSNINKSIVFDNIVISTWKNNEFVIRDNIDFPLTFIRSDLPENPGIGNRNAQIKSSRLGMREVHSKYCVKFRSDQIFGVTEIVDMGHFYRKFSKQYPGSCIFTLGMYKSFPFHPRDHLFWGQTKFLDDLFDIPMDEEPKTDKPDYTKSLRAEAYIGSKYYSHYNVSVFRYLLDPKNYLVDNAPNLSEALATYHQMNNENICFHPFPKIDFSWPKHNLSSYHFHIGEQLSEYWHE